MLNTSKIILPHGFKYEQRKTPSNLPFFSNSDYLKRIFNNASRRDWREDLKKRMIHFDLEKCNYYQKLQQCGLGNDLTENWHVAIYQQVMLKNSKKCIHVNCRSYLVVYLRVWYEKNCSFQYIIKFNCDTLYQFYFETDCRGAAVDYIITVLTGKM